ncbi:MAG: glycerophosphodiester phosphodiesterase [Microbacteriaceae bacterium]|nr:MAG: glycerophosphodiester phosphodiesterase [Microbacteriaceae bacterium]
MRDGAYFATRPPRIFAHRGLAIGVPENTPPAFRAALGAGATHLETDVHASADSVAVISHDPDLTRIAGRASSVERLTMAQLRSVDLGGGQGFASLTDVLTEFPHASFNVDVKSPRAVEPTARAILAAGATDRVLVTSFSNRRRTRTVALLPGVATSASSIQVLWAVLGARLRFTPLVRLVARAIDALQIPERYGPFRLVTAQSVSAWHAAGLEVHVWTVNDPSDMQRLLRLGVDGIITDRCDLAFEVIAADS